ncbi:hypothetical protein JM47_00280 [Ureaplasma diversum]|uniref:Impact N-terminal domain-containing protein n=1 Tax=Ureaplasma diversum TaxID=42094 RepID=A0A0C5S158_9BACT|nr:YigZ family protein [Ureaplasma diversum]AJQ45105.1 hypothetical protein JM47_00280 [Ureaplasma diversum]
MKYQTIKSNSSAIFEINKSKFLAFVFNVIDIDQANELIHKYKQEYKDARHVVYAYIIGESANQIKCSDDNEPSGTAGLPILSLLQQKALTNVILIVVRYFGGIKLGANGLVKAYRNSAKLVLDKTEFIDLIKYYYYQIKYNLEHTNQFNHFCYINDLVIIRTSYEQNSVLVYVLSKQELNQIDYKYLDCELIKYDY